MDNIIHTSLYFHVTKNNLIEQGQTLLIYLKKSHQHASSTNPIRDPDNGDG